MIQNLSRYFLFLSILSLVSCTITKRKYTSGFYVDWHKKSATIKVPEQAKTIPRVRNKLAQTNTSLGEKAVEAKTGNSIIKPVIIHLKQEREAKNSVYTSVVNSTATGNMDVRASNRSDKRFLDNGLTGFEAAVLNLLVFGLLLFVGHLGYTVFILGCLLLIIALTIYSLVYCFMGLNSNDKHRGLALIGVLIDVGVFIGLLLVGLGG